MVDEVRLWLWRYTDEFGKRRVSSYRLTDADAHARLRDPEKVDGSLEIRTPQSSTSAFMDSLRKP